MNESPCDKAAHATARTKPAATFTDTVPFAAVSDWFGFSRRDLRSPCSRMGQCLRRPEKHDCIFFGVNVGKSGPCTREDTRSPAPALLLRSLFFSCRLGPGLTGGLPRKHNPSSTFTLSLSCLACLDRRDAVFDACI